MHTHQPHFRRSGEARPRRQSGKRQTGEIFGKRRQPCSLSILYVILCLYQTKQRPFGVRHGVLTEQWIFKGPVSGWIELLKCCSLGTLPRQWEAHYHISQKSSRVFVSAHREFSHGANGASCLNREIQFPKYRNTCSWCRPPPAPNSLMIAGFPRAHCCRHRNTPWCTPQYSRLLTSCIHSFYFYAIFRVLNCTPKSTYILDKTA